MERVEDMAAEGRRFSGWPSLFLIAALLTIVGQSYCQPTNLPETHHNVKLGETSGRRGRDLLGHGLYLANSLVGSPKRGGQSQALADSPSLIYFTSCPKEASETPIPLFQRRLMFFHRPGDTLRTELRLEEMVGPKKQRSWNTSTIDLMVSDYDFDLSKPTLMYTHGYLQDTEETFLARARANYDKIQANRAKPSYNMLLFDWGAFAYNGYKGCVGETPRTAKLLAEFFEYLHTKHNYDLGKLHLVSFSLSAHISGQAARILAKKQRVGQITYLDPTGVCFHDAKSKVFGDKYGARDDDATLTVAKHYNMFGFGSYRDHVGRVNVQVNDGKNQRRAPTKRGVMTEIFKSLFPSHLYAVHHNVHLFDPAEDCHDMAYECSSYANFLKGECGSCGKSNETCLLMSTVGNLELGIDLTKVNFKPNSRMFVTTAELQFCAYQYQVIVTMKDSPTPEVTQSFTSGAFSFRLAEGFVVRPTNRRGKQFTQLVRPTKRVTSFPGSIDMSKDSKLVNLIESVRIRYLSHYSADTRRKWSVTYCPESSGKSFTKCTK